jgi:hypothetical protein
VDGEVAEVNQIMPQLKIQVGALLQITILHLKLKMDGEPLVIVILLHKLRMLGEPLKIIILHLNLKMTVGAKLIIKIRILNQQLTDGET